MNQTEAEPNVMPEVAISSQWSDNVRERQAEHVKTLTDTDTLSREQVLHYTNVLQTLWKYRFKPKNAKLFNEALMKLANHYSYVSEQYVQQCGDDRKWVASYLPTELGHYWELIDRNEYALSARSRGGLKIILSGVKELDGKRWMHLSVSREDRIPNWSDLTEVKEKFLGRDVEAVLKFAPRSQWVNLMPYCMHLWHCVDGDVTPDFTHGSGTI